MRLLLSVVLALGALSGCTLFDDDTEGSPLPTSAAPPPPGVVEDLTRVLRRRAVAVREDRARQFRSGLVAGDRAFRRAQAAYFTSVRQLPLGVFRYSFDPADILRVDAMKLVLESKDRADEHIRRLGEVLHVAAPGFIDDYVTQGRNLPVRGVTLRQVQLEESPVYGDKTDYIRSEALLKLDFGPGRSPGLLVMGSEDPHLFTPQQGTDLLAFFGGVFERAMRRWLS